MDQLGDWTTDAFKWHKLHWCIATNHVMGVRALLTWRGDFTPVIQREITLNLVTRSSSRITTPAEIIESMIVEYIKNPDEQRKLHRRQFLVCNQDDSARVFSFFILIESALLTCAQQ